MKTKAQPRPKLSDFIWWHVCGETRRREYRKHGFDCRQCGAVGPQGVFVAQACALLEQVLAMHERALHMQAQGSGVKA